MTEAMDRVLTGRPRTFLWDTTMGRQPLLLENGPPHLCALSFSADGLLMMAAGSVDSLRLFRAADIPTADRVVW